MVKRNVYLGPNETKLLLELEKEEKFLFTITDVKDILDSSDSSVWSVLYRLKEKNRITEIERGKYILSPAKSGIEGYWSEYVYRVLPFILNKYYVSYWSALNFWHMTDQIPRTTFVVTLKSKSPVKFNGEYIKFVKVNEKKFYGIASHELSDGTEFQIATQEKTIIDCLDMPQYAGGIVEIARAIYYSWSKLNTNNLLKYANKFPNKTVKKRIGFLLDIDGGLNKKMKKDLLPISKGYSWLDSSAQKKNYHLNKEWGLKINVNEKYIKDAMRG